MGRVVDGEAERDGQEDSRRRLDGLHGEGAKERHISSFNAVLGITSR